MGSTLGRAGAGTAAARHESDDVVAISGRLLVAGTTAERRLVPVAGSAFAGITADRGRAVFTSAAFGTADAVMGLAVLDAVLATRIVFAATGAKNFVAAIFSTSFALASTRGVVLVDAFAAIAVPPVQQCVSLRCVL